MVYLLSKTGVSVCDGDPKYYLDDTTLKKVLNDNTIANALFQALGTCCFARLGGAGKDGIYSDNSPEVQLNVTSYEKGELSYYERLW